MRRVVRPAGLDRGNDDGKSPTIPASTRRSALFAARRTAGCFRVPDTLRPLEVTDHYANIASRCGACGTVLAPSSDGVRRGPVRATQPPRREPSAEFVPEKRWTEHDAHPPPRSTIRRGDRQALLEANLVLGAGRASGWSRSSSAAKPQGARPLPRALHVLCDRPAHKRGTRRCLDLDWHHPMTITPPDDQSHATIIRSKDRIDISPDRSSRRKTGPRNRLDRARTQESDPIVAVRTADDRAASTTPSRSTERSSLGSGPGKPWTYNAKTPHRS